jgi:hypothetical protein
VQVQVDGVGVELDLFRWSNDRTGTKATFYTHGENLTAHLTERFHEFGSLGCVWFVRTIDNAILGNPACVSYCVY